MKTLKRSILSILILLLLPIGTMAAARFMSHGNVGPYPEHTYYYYPKQNLYYVPSKHVYYAWHQEHWVKYSSIPAFYGSVHLNIMPRVTLHMATLHPYYYNPEHREHYRPYIYAQMATTPAVIYRQKAPHKYQVTMARDEPHVRTEVSIEISPIIVHSGPVYSYSVRYKHPGKGHGPKFKGHGHGHH